MKRAGTWLMALVFMILTLCGALATGQQKDYQPMQYGDQGEAIVSVQEQLSALGYYSGKVSGNFLDGTRAAVKLFQKDYGLKETGIVDGETEALLMTAEYRALTTSSDGEDVKRVQDHLSSLGYFDGKSTGKYRSQTAAAMKDFQAANGLEVTGDANVATQRLLFSGKALAKNAPPAVTPDPNTDVGDINDVVMVEDGADNDAALEISEYIGKLRRGAKGERVKQVQERMKELGFFDGPISGNYMNQTMAAVENFQHMNGLRADGVTGEETWNLMFNSEDVLNSEATPRPTPVPTPVPYAITVDVRNQAVLVYEPDIEGEYTVPVRKMVCSTGLKATPSDVGEFVLTGRRARWCYFPTWGSHAQYWTRINRNIAFHSVIYNRVDTMALSKKSYNLLGSRASHGCIRLLVSDAKWIYDNIDEGVVVTIREDLPADQELVKSLRPPALNTKNMLPYSTPQPTAEPDYDPGAPPPPFRTLKKGHSGEDVYWLQSKLTDLGYYTGAITGSFYSGTQNAVKDYQKANGIYANGTVNEKTWDSLYQDVLQTATPQPTDTPHPTPSQSSPPVPTPMETPAP